jgi:hypothetical protein
LSRLYRRIERKRSDHRYLAQIEPGLRQATVAVKYGIRRSRCALDVRSKTARCIWVEP